MHTATIRIEGSATPASARSICSALSVIPGVVQVQMGGSGEALVHYDPRKVDTMQFLTAVTAVDRAVRRLVIEAGERVRPDWQPFTPAADF